jgi:hypothetical protein
MAPERSQVPARARKESPMTEPLSNDAFTNDPAAAAGTPGADPAGAAGAGPDPVGGAPAGESGWTSGPTGEEAGPGRSGEWLAQLEAMIQQISSQAAPVARQVGAKAAELAAIAAVKAGPAAQKAAELTQEYGSRFAERAQSVAAELRAHDTKAPGDTAAEAAVPEATADPTEEPAPEDTAGSNI